MATDDSVLRQRGRQGSTILADIQAAAARGAAQEERQEDAEPREAPIVLPQPGDSYDAAYSRPANKPVPTLYFLLGDQVRGLPYASLDSIDWQPSEKPGAGPAIIVRFAGIVPRVATVTGRNIYGLVGLLGTHRITWLRELPKGRDFKGEGATVITGISIERITEVPE